MKSLVDCYGESKPHVHRESSDVQRRVRRDLEEKLCKRGVDVLELRQYDRGFLHDRSGQVDES